MLAAITLSLAILSLGLASYGFSLLRQIEALELNLARRAAAARRPGAPTAGNLSLGRRGR